MNVLFRFLKWFEVNWNERIPEAPYHVYTKDSYSHYAKKRLIVKAWSEAEAVDKVLELKNKYDGVLFFYE